MSIWTHVSAILRIDDMSIYGNKPIDWSNIFIKSTWGHKNNKCNIPIGSEGSLDVGIIDNTEEGTEYMKTISIFGDLRDYDNLLKIRDWWVNIKKVLPKGCNIRQGILLAECETGKKLIMTHEEMHKIEGEDDD